MCVCVVDDFELIFEAAVNGGGADGDGCCFVRGWNVVRQYQRIRQVLLALVQVDGHRTTGWVCPGNGIWVARSDVVAAGRIIDDIVLSERRGEAG